MDYSINLQFSITAEGQYKALGSRTLNLNMKDAGTGANAVITEITDSILQALAPMNIMSVEDYLAAKEREV